MLPLKLTKKSWSKPLEIYSFYEDFYNSEESSGVYIIRKAGSVKRVGGVDKTGILYIGKAKKLNFRIYGFLTANHQASGFLWDQLDIAKLVINRRINGPTELKDCLNKLTVRFAPNIGKRKLNSAERALFFSYMNLFGEPPPLNLNIPSRWDSKPPTNDLHWAEAGIKTRS